MCLCIYCKKIVSSKIYLSKLIKFIHILSTLFFFEQLFFFSSMKSMDGKVGGENSRKAMDELKGNMENRLASL